MCHASPGPHPVVRVGDDIAAREEEGAAARAPVPTAARAAHVVRAEVGVVVPTGTRSRHTTRTRSQVFGVSAESVAPLSVLTQRVGDGVGDVDAEDSKRP